MNALWGALFSIIVMQPWPGGVTAPVPVLKWNLDETGSTTLAAAVGTYTGTAGATITSSGGTINTVAGKIGTALKFGNSASAYAISVDATLWNTWPTSYTICMWFKRVSATGQDTLWAKTTRLDFRDRAQLALKADNKLAWISTSDNVSVTALASTTGYTNDTWAHVAIVVTPAGRTLYLNGNSDATDTVTTRPLDTGGGYSGNGVTIGAVRTASASYDSLDGTLDDVRMYAVALTQPQIAAIVAEAD